jgi:hypothetical protein
MSQCTSSITIIKMEKNSLKNKIKCIPFLIFFAIKKELILSIFPWGVEWVIIS